MTKRACACTDDAIMSLLSPPSPHSPTFLYHFFLYRRRFFANVRILRRSPAGQMPLLLGCPHLASKDRKNGGALAATVVFYYFFLLLFASLHDTCTAVYGCLGNRLSRDTSACCPIACLSCMGYWRDYSQTGCIGDCCPHTHLGKGVLEERRKLNNVYKVEL